jgi:UDP-2,3-diacylglucosamine hydrolase
MSEAIKSQSSKKHEAQAEAVALFVSDLHLQPSLSRTTQAFLDFLSQHASKAHQLYLLGDLFEYWAGDDDIASPYHAHLVKALRALSDAGVAIYWIAGNRDFLVGQGLAKAAGMILLAEPHVTTISGQRIVLIHGDAQCTDDAAYMEFRKKVRDPAWQAEFLALPLAQRKAIIDGMRSGSREAQRGKSYEIMDVNPGAIAALFDATGATVMIHGHTHRPAIHEHHSGEQMRTRYVLPDWDCDTEAARGGWLALHASGKFQRFNVDGTLDEFPSEQQP